MDEQAEAGPSSQRMDVDDVPSPPVKKQKRKTASPEQQQTALYKTTSVPFLLEREHDLSAFSADRPYTARPLTEREEAMDEEKREKMLRRRQMDAARKRRKEMEKRAAKLAAAGESTQSSLTSVPSNESSQTRAEAGTEAHDASGSSSPAPVKKTATKKQQQKKKPQRRPSSATPAPNEIHRRESTSLRESTTLVDEDEEMAEADSQEDPDSEVEKAQADGQEEEEKLWCICQIRYEPGEEPPMIACDRCDDWYHGQCVGIEDEKIQLVDMFVCPKCELHTPDRTTWKPVCSRLECPQAARVPLSRYCSERCGILSAASRMSQTKYAKPTAAQIDKLYNKQVQTAQRKEYLVTWNEDEAVSKLWLERFDLTKAVADHDSTHSMPSKEHEEIIDLESEAIALLTRKQQSSAALDLVMARIKLLQLTEDRITLLPPIETPEESTAKSKSKTKGKKSDESSAIKTQPRCGFDERLAWDDESFVEWMNSDIGSKILREEQDLDGQLVTEDDQEDDSVTGPAICGTSKRKCKRHLDWNVVRSADFDVEKEAQVSLTQRATKSPAVAQYLSFPLDFADQYPLSLVRARASHSKPHP